MQGQPLFLPIDDSLATYAGLELLATATLLLTRDLNVSYANPAAENLFELSKRQLVGNPVRLIFGDAPALSQAIDKALASGASYTEQEIELGAAGKPRLHLSCTVSVVDTADATLLLECRHIDQQLKIATDFDISLPEFEADPEQLMQAVFNVVRNAAQALENTTVAPQIRLTTRVARGVTLAKRRYRLALALSIEDNGSGVLESIRDK